MGKEVLVYGYVKDGALKLYNQGALSSGIQNFEGQDVELVVRKRFRIFGDNLRGYYFGVVVKQYQEALYYAWGEKWTLTDIDYYLRSLFLYREIVDEDTGEIHKEICTLRKGETDVSREEFLEYVRYLVQVAAYYLSWPIPLPNEELDAQERVNKRRTIAESTATR